MTWLSGWTRRKIKIVENLTVSDYQMKLIINKSGSGPDTSTDIYLGGNCRDDFADLRFTGPDQTTLLSYWIESITGTTPNLVATVWIKIPTLTPTNNIYIYYDNPIASPVSNGSNTFIFFDDFNNGSQWITESGSPSYSGSLVTLSSGARIRTNNDYSINTQIRFKLKFSGSTWDRDFGGYADVLADPTGSGLFAVVLADSINNLNFRNRNVSHTQTGIGANDYNFHNYIIIRNGSSSIIYIKDTTTPITHITNIPTGGMRIKFGDDSARPGTTIVDFVFVGNYTSPEPIFGVSGTEELNITAIDMILNTNTCIESCQIIAGVTWQNMGSSNVTFTPAVLINGTTIAYATSNITIGPYPATGSSTITTPTLLAGTHTICPYPN